MNESLDVSPYDNPAVTKFKVTLGTSSELETKAGQLPPSIVIFGPMYQFKEFVKDQFSAIRYVDLVFDGAVKVCARPQPWRLVRYRAPPPCALRVTSRALAAGGVGAPTQRRDRRDGHTRALPQHASGVDVTEVDLDEESDDEGDDAELIDDEAREAAPAADEEVVAEGE